MLNASPTLFAAPRHRNIISEREGESIWRIRQRKILGSTNMLPQERKFELSSGDSTSTLQEKRKLASQLKPANRFSKHITPSVFEASLRRASVAEKSRNGEKPRPIEFQEVVPEIVENSWIGDALNDLDKCPTEALDEGFVEPSEVGLAKAKKVLKHISTYILEQPEIYPMDEGAIAIDFRNPRLKSGLFILIEFDGSGALFYRTDKLRGRMRVSDALDLLVEADLSKFEKLNIR